MKNALKVSVLLLSSVLVFSCGEQSSNEHNHADEPAATEHHSHTGDMSLDDGKLWAANAETTEGVNNMIKLMDAFSDHDDVAAYGKLTESLEAEFTMIFQKCTMQGESHNQLHSFLLPMKKLFKAIGGTDLETCKSSFGELKAHLGEYKNFFE